MLERQQVTLIIGLLFKEIAFVLHQKHWQQVHVYVFQVRVKVLGLHVLTI